MGQRSRSPSWNTRAATGSMSRSIGSISSSPIAPPVTGTRPRRDCTGWARPRGSASATRRALRFAPWPLNCSTCTRGGSSRMATHSRPTRRGSASWSPPSFMKTRRTSARPRRRSSATWSVPARWTACSWATWVTARPKSRCAARSRRCRRGSKSPCSCPRPFWPNSTAARFANDSPTTRCGSRCCRGFARPKRPRRSSSVSRRVRSTS